MGRKDRGETTFRQMKTTAEKLGFKITMLPFNHRYYKAKTIRTLQRKILAGSFLVYTQGHVSAIVDCEVEDWAKNSCKRIGSIYKVEKL